MNATSPRPLPEGVTKLWSRFRVAEMSVRILEHWTIVVRPQQVTLGACLLLLNRAATSFADLTDAECAELPVAAKWYEERAKVVFGAEKFNYVAAMMKDPWFHFHVIPRYSHAASFMGQEWVDSDWPALVTFRRVDTEDAVLEAVKTALAG